MTWIGKETIDKISKHIDKWGYGILKFELNPKEKEICELLANNSLLLKTDISYLSTPLMLWHLFGGSKTSEEMKKLKKEVKVYSISELDSWNNCQIAYKLKRLDKLQAKGVPSYAMYGSLAHDIQEQYILKKLNKEECLKEFKERLERLKKLGANLPRDFRGKSSIQDNYEIAMYDYFKHNYTDLDNFKYRVEKEVYGMVRDIHLMGYIDLIKIKRRENGIHYVDIVDFKTSTMYSKKDLGEKAQQLILYKLLLEQQFPNIKVENVCWDFMKYVKTTFKGRSKIQSRKDDYIGHYKDKLIKELGEEKAPLIEMWCKNKTIPKEYKDILKVENAYVEFELGDNAFNDLEVYIKETIKSINNGIDKNIFVGKDIEKDSFFCNTLCGYKKDCPNFNISNSSPTMNEILQMVLERRNN